MEKQNNSIGWKIWKLIKDNPIVVLLAIVSLIVGCTIPRFFSFQNLNALISNTTIRFLMALGVSGCAPVWPAPCSRTLPIPDACITGPRSTCSWASSL